MLPIEFCAFNDSEIAGTKRPREPMGGSTSPTLLFISINAVTGFDPGGLGALDRSDYNHRLAWGSG